MDRDVGLYAVDEVGGRGDGGIGGGGAGGALAGGAGVAGGIGHGALDGPGQVGELVAREADLFARIAAQDGGPGGLGQVQPGERVGAGDREGEEGEAIDAGRGGGGRDVGGVAKDIAHGDRLDGGDRADRLAEWDAVPVDAVDQEEVDDEQLAELALVGANGGDVEGAVLERPEARARHAAEGGDGGEEASGVDHGLGGGRGAARLGVEGMPLEQAVAGAAGGEAERGAVGVVAGELDGVVQPVGAPAGGVAVAGGDGGRAGEVGGGGEGGADRGLRHRIRRRGRREIRRDVGGRGQERDAVDAAAGEDVDGAGGGGIEEARLGGERADGEGGAEVTDESALPPRGERVLERGADLGGQAEVAGVAFLAEEERLERCGGERTRVAARRAPGVGAAEAPANRDEGRRRGVLAVKLAELPLPAEEPGGIADAGGDGVGERGRARARLEAAPVGDRRHG